MKKFLLTFIVAFCGLYANAVTVYLTSISKESNGRTENTTLSYNDSEDWTLVSVNDEGSELSFDRSQLSSNILKMTRVDEDGDTTLYEMTLDKDGNVVKVYEYDNGILDEAYTTFEYTDGFLTNYKQINGVKIRETIITYENYHVSKVETINIGDDSSKEVTTFEYENGIIGYTPLTTLWDIFFNVELDDLQWLSLSNYLGYWSNVIPSKITIVSNQGTEVKTLNWKCCSYGYPDSITITSGDNVEVYDFTLDLNGAINVEPIINDGNTSARFYNINGVEVSGDAKGIVIERKGDGSVVKHINR